MSISGKLCERVKIGNSQRCNERCEFFDRNKHTLILTKAKYGVNAQKNKQHSNTDDLNILNFDLVVDGEAKLKSRDLWLDFGHFRIYIVPKL